MMPYDQLQLLATEERSYLEIEKLLQLDLPSLVLDPYGYRLADEFVKADGLIVSLANRGRRWLMPWVLTSYLKILR